MELDACGDEVAVRLKEQLKNGEYSAKIVASGYGGNEMMLLSPSELPKLCAFFGVKRPHVDIIASRLDDLRIGLGQPVLPLRLSGHD